MPDPTTIPGVRVGQVWQPTGVPEGEQRGLLLVVRLELYEVILAGVRPDGTRTGRRTSSLRWQFERRYRLVSEPAPIDMGCLSLPAEVQRETESGGPA